MKKQQGFTLIELMIVVAIIAILAAIALPMYQDYVAKSQTAAGLAEVTGGKTAAEVALNEGKDFAAAVDIGLKVSTRCPTVTVSGVASTGVASIACTLAGNSQVKGKSITLTRAAADGTWTCATTVAAKYAPTGCTGV
ncbi:pilin [Stenotrophomonas sp.]|uniref:pilin n=1 Tax=Stenotrophomonas sp. TaxID=69392 RepID=UPI00289D41C6|nr:pilin [Stenotrophomonas sp.]